MSTLIVAAAVGSALMALPAAPPTRPPSAGAARAAPAPTLLATTPLWQPPEGQPRRARRRRPLPPSHESPTANNTSTEALEQQVFGAEPGNTIRRAPARSGDDDEADDEDDDQPRGGRAAKAIAALPPVIAPHLMTFGLGTSLMGRSFRFDAPLQPDSGFPREGLVAELESFPLLHADGWYARFGAGASFSTEIGSAGVAQADGGTLSYPVTERRWAFDLRYAVPLGQRFLIVPLVGYGRSGYDLGRRTQPAPSTCAAASTQVCVPDVQLSHLTFGFDARLALRPMLALSLGAALLPGFGLGSGMGQLGVESAASALGVSFTAAVSWQILDWLALRAAVPVTRYGYDFSRRPLAYTSASETYYGLVVGATAFVR
jgi:hypothetical protein